MTVSLGALLRRHVKPHYQVLCVGPYTSPFHDPSALYASVLVGKGSGRVHLLDSQSHIANRAFLTASGRDKIGSF